MSWLAPGDNRLPENGCSCGRIGRLRPPRASSIEDRVVWFDFKVIK